MPIDINLFRTAKGGNPELVRESQRKRFQSVEIVDEIIELDNQWVKASYDLAQARKVLNDLSKQFAVAKKANESTDDLTEQITQAKAKIATADDACSALESSLDNKVNTIGNLVPEDVPVSNDEENNCVRYSSHKTEDLPPQAKLNHIGCFKAINGSDTIRGTKVAGSRGYFLCGFGALLNQALIQYAQKFLASRGFITMQTPFFLEKNVMARCAQLADFDEQLYKVSGEGNDKYLIATSEQSLCSYFSDEVVDIKAFNNGYKQYREALKSKYYTETHKGYFEQYAPLTEEEFEQGVILFGGYSSCFRKEVGKHGQDTLGIFRIHQFEKVEQLILCKPELSHRLHAMMISLSMEFYDSLNIPYRVVDIVSGALNDAACRKFDLEGWFPASQCYRELVSCSNCLDFQSRALNIKDQSKKYYHLLNSTLTATERTMCAIVENCQKDGFIEVPEALRNYMGVDKFPFEIQLQK
ncbi:Seryl-tRNA synthetase [Spironucleus salmonicida]|uniref:serine--tRNA ligase n=1 Tax=Spironucleus salmonicida TaxID=348837 RepID=V6LS33_9EUKA|nr:Seryl-tRNA synthetase [Spironucleus salmonicida]|eukprot:EST47068.1 Seryl-tRNA synthetase [Spironucleus salmonicida]